VLPQRRNGQSPFLGEDRVPRVKHLLFVWKPTGYELHERDGELPQVGAVVEEEDLGRMVVTRIGPSPLPGDDRRCAYLQAA
jgi:hypothetical protein